MIHEKKFKESALRLSDEIGVKKAAEQLVLHSDRGSQYTSDAFKEKPKKLGLIQSLRGVAHCYDNARMESFFETLKKELIYRLPVYRMIVAEVKERVFCYVFVYYNRIRVYTDNPFGYPPAVFRELQHSQAAA